MEKLLYISANPKGLEKSKGLNMAMKGQNSLPSLFNFKAIS